MPPLVGGVEGHPVGSEEPLLEPVQLAARPATANTIDDQTEKLFIAMGSVGRRHRG
jgi:hypothetical protein